MQVCQSSILQNALCAAQLPSNTPSRERFLSQARLFWYFTAPLCHHSEAANPVPFKFDHPIENAVEAGVLQLKIDIDEFWQCGF